jgi:hypothetical protein
MDTKANRSCPSCNCYGTVEMLIMHTVGTAKTLCIMRHAIAYVSHYCDACDLRQKCDRKSSIVLQKYMYYTEKNCSKDVCLALSSSLHCRFVQNFQSCDDKSSEN